MNVQHSTGYILLIASVCFWLGCNGGDIPDMIPRVDTTSGPVTGVTATNSHAFYQIPYAEPPVGDLRWKDPMPAKTSPKDIDASVDNPVRCFQESSSLEVIFTLSEDCLVLNVFVPLTVTFPLGSSAPNLPVMFFIHGGGFKYGSGTDSTYKANELARVTNSIIVTINYRLGPLGFLTLEEEGEEYIVGNQGLKDQRLALQWVQDNIGKFGGDKNQVTIFGNSAGALSVMLHTVSPKSKSLFRAAIQQSNPAIYSFYHMTPAAALRVSRRLIEALGCNGTNTTERQCLMDANPPQIIAVVVGVEAQTSSAEGSHIYIEETFFPIIDGEDVTDLPMNLLQSGQWNKETDLIIGVNTEESLDFQYYFPPDVKVDEIELKSYFESSFGSEFAEEIAKKYIQEYPPSQGQDYRAAFGHALSHYTYDCPSKFMARYAANTGDGNVYFYANSHAVLFEFCTLVQNGNSIGCKIAYHASELPYVFRTLEDSQNLDDRRVQDEFSTYWGSFARTQSPSNNLEIPVGTFTPWPKYRNSSTNGLPAWSYLEIGSPNSTVKNGYKDAICDFWASINFARPRPIIATTIEISNPATPTATAKETTTSSAGTVPLFELMIAITAIAQTICLL